jgi:hypothetical protein
MRHPFGGMALVMGGMVMADIPCRVCGEPWDSFSLKDGTFEPWEAKLFKAGKGCPHCHFGKKPPTLTDEQKAELTTACIEGLVESTDDGEEQDGLIDGYTW